MNAAEIATTQMIEETLKHSAAFRKVDDTLYVIKQGSAYVMINVLKWGKDRAMVRCHAQLVQGIDLDAKLATELLELNAHLNFGAFAWERDNQAILFTHTIVGGETLDSAELLATLNDVALIADDYDDKLRNKYGGQRMVDLLEEAALERVVTRDASAFKFGAK